MLWHMVACTYFLKCRSTSNTIFLQTNQTDMPAKQYRHSLIKSPLFAISFLIKQTHSNLEDGGMWSQDLNLGYSHVQGGHLVLHDP